MLTVNTYILIIEANINKLQGRNESIRIERSIGPKTQFQTLYSDYDLDRINLGIHRMFHKTMM